MSNRDNLTAWRANRNIQSRQVTYSSYRVFVKNILEELLEPLYKKDVIQEKVTSIINTHFIDGLHLTSEHEVIDAITDMRVFCENQTEIYGYNSDKTLAEVIKEISSREQDPVQYKLWSKYGHDGSKWQKNVNQNLATLYKADFSQCIL